MFIIKELHSGNSVDVNSFHQSNGFEATSYKLDRDIGSVEFTNPNMVEQGYLYIKSDLPNGQGRDGCDMIIVETMTGRTVETIRAS